MKLALLLLLLPFITYSQNQYTEKVVEHRKEKNAEYKDTLKSPFHKEQIANFNSLNYFTPNPKFNIQAKFVKELGYKTSQSMRPTTYVFLFILLVLCAIFLYVKY